MKSLNSACCSGGRCSNCVTGCCVCISLEESVESRTGQLKTYPDMPPVRQFYIQRQLAAHGFHIAFQG